MDPSKHILIVEDDPTLLRGLSDNFRAAGYEVSMATDGQLGLTLALTQPPDVMLLDIMLPKINGYDLCRRVRHEKHDFPIVMLTAKGQEEEIVRGLELGADDYVTKPFGIRELLARVARLLRRDRIDSKQVVLLGKLVLDRDARQLTHDGEEIPLTQKEYRLLDYFVANPQRALTRSSILDAVWGRSIIVSHRSVDRCVTTLRSKVETQPGQPKMIQTIRDIGYRFEVPKT
ncbi:response regulator transcription factor [Rhodopirellula sallentina]|uniref:response regulator transcription factor n=1 Tax=Rhodopirellula sallentina TaxID=1263869 RepID=UPI0005C7AD0D|nr:response regulator transcription factor [Rhodopirellula sallentina]